MAAGGPTCCLYPHTTILGQTNVINHPVSGALYSSPKPAAVTLPAGLLVSASLFEVFLFVNLFKCAFIVHLKRVVFILV